MKKSIYFSIMALALGLTACENYDLPNPPGQSNPQEPVLEAEGIKVEAGEATQQTLDLATLIEEGESITFGKVETTDFPSTSELKMVMEISASDQFAKTTEVANTIVDGEILVEPAILQDAYKAGISKGPKEKTVYYRYAAYAVNGKEVVRIGNPDFYYGPFEMSVLPVPSEFVIQDNYYLVGNICDWNTAEAVPFNHSDINVYDDPVFTLKVDITPEEAANGWWWKIITEPVKEGGWDAANFFGATVGVAENGDEAMEGMLMPKPLDSDCGAGCIKQAGSWLITINMEDLTYKFTMAIDNLWTPGVSNNWSPSGSQMLYTNDYAVYYGYAYLTGEFKFTSAPDWEHLNFGNGGDGNLSTDNGVGNLSVEKDGLYWLKANIAALTWEKTEVETIGVIGDATPNGWDASTPLLHSPDFLIWKGDVKLTGGKEFKFRANDGWTINLGGDLNNLVQDGGNIKVEEDGTYEVTLYLDLLPYSATLVKK